MVFHFIKFNCMTLSVVIVRFVSVADLLEPVDDGSKSQVRICICLM